MSSDEGCACKPLGFLLSLPFAIISILISLIGAVLSLVLLVLTVICPCCCCVWGAVDIAYELVKAPIYVVLWFTSKIPC